MKSMEARFMAPNQEPKSGRAEERSPESGRCVKQTVTPMPERMEELESLEHEDAQKAEEIRVNIRGDERIRLANVERDNVVFFGKKKKDWEKELDALEGAEALTSEEGRRKSELMARIDKVDAMEKQAEAVERCDEQEHIAKEKAEEMGALQQKLDQLERERKDAENAAKEKARDLALQQKHLQGLQESFALNAAEDVKTQIDAMPQILQSLEADVERYQGVATDLADEHIKQKAEMEDVMVEHTQALQEAHQANRVAVELGSVIAAMSIDIGKGLEPRAEAGVAATETREQAQTVVSRNHEAPKRTPRAHSRRFAASMVYLGGGVAFVGSVASHAVYYPFRMASRFFENLYHLTMHPGKFFSEMGSKYSSEMQDPPKGRGKAMGFIEGTRYLLFGKRVEETEKAKEKAKKKVDKKK